MILLIGKDLSYLEQLERGLSLSEEEVMFVQTARELEKVCNDLDHFLPELVLVDMLYISNGGGEFMTNMAVEQLRQAGYEGTIGACSTDRIINNYLEKNGADFSCGEWKDGGDINCPELSLHEICAAISPHLYQ